MMQSSVTRLEITSPVKGWVEKAAVKRRMSAFLARGEIGKFVIAIMVTLASFPAFDAVNHGFAAT